MNAWFDRMIPHLLFSVTTMMVLFGLVMVYSSGAFSDYRLSIRSEWESAIKTAVDQAILGQSDTGGPGSGVSSLVSLSEEDAVRRASMLSNFLKQAQWAVLGFVALTIAALIDYPTWGRRIGWLLVIVVGFQILLYVIPANTGFIIQSRIVNGARSWLQFLSFRIQPSEMAKLGLIIFTACYLSGKRKKEEMNFLSILPGMCLIAFSVGLILLESDKGVSAHLCLALLLLWVVAGGKMTHVFALGGAAVVGVGGMILMSPNALRRIIEHLSSTPFQLKQAYGALGRGGLFGIGLGDSDAALAYLYAADTDFILAIIGEELGFVATSLVVVGYTTLFLLGLKVSTGCSDPFGSTLALGITLLLGTQAVLNMCVVTGLVPITGFTLPLISRGGSSLTWTMIGIGILINISRSTHNQLLSNKKRSKVGTFGSVGAIA